MPCNARVVVTAKAKIKDINKLPYVTKTGSGYTSRLNTLVTMDIDKAGNAVLKYTGDNWDEGVAMLGKALFYLRDKCQVEFSDVGKPETHRHQHIHIMEGVRLCG